MNNEKVLARIIAIRALFVDDVGKFYKFASFWVFALIGAAPNIYDALTANALIDKVPPAFATILHGLAITGIAMRFIKQQGIRK